MLDRCFSFLSQVRFGGSTASRRAYGSTVLLGFCWLASIATPTPAVQPLREVVMTVSQPVSELPSDKQQLDTLYSTPSHRYSIVWDRRSNRPLSIHGTGIPVFTATSQGPSLASAEASVRQFLAQHETVFKLEDLTDTVFELDAQRSGRLGRDGRFWSFVFQPFFEGIPVIDSAVFVRLTHGTVTNFGSQRVSQVRASPTPTFDVAELAPQIIQELSLEDGNASAMEPGHLVWITVSNEDTEHPGYEHRLAWSFNMLSEEGAYEVLADAHSGALLRSRALELEAGASQVKAWVRDLEGDGSLVSRPLPGLELLSTASPPQSLGFTDDEGRHGLSSSYVVGLDGLSVEIYDDCGGYTSSPAQGSLLLGDPSLCSAGCEGARFSNGDTHTARTAYHYAADLIYRIDQLPGSSLPDLTIEINEQPSDTNTRVCNGFWSSLDRTVRLAPEGGGCANAGEIPSIVAHEIGHAYDETLGHVTPDGATGEAVADVFAYLATDDTCIGRGLTPHIPCEGCRLTCDGLRDLEPFLIGGGSQPAHPRFISGMGTLGCSSIASPDTFEIPSQKMGWMGYDAHCESQIATAAMVDLDRFLRSRYGDSIGRAKLEELWKSAQVVAGSAYKPRTLGTNPPEHLPYLQDSGLQNPGFDGCSPDSWYWTLIVADEDENPPNLNNGTPNRCLIYAAFEGHGIGPSPRDGTNLLPTEKCDDIPEVCTGPIDAGPDVEICQGNSVTLGPSTVPNNVDVWWSEGGAVVGTTPRLTTPPLTQSTTYTFSAFRRMDPTDNRPVTPWTDEVTVFVNDCHGRAFDFESAAMLSDWQLTGLWHHADALLGCGSMVPNGTGALRFGREDSCATFDNCGVARGKAISPPITDILSTTSLSFLTVFEGEPFDPEDPGLWDQGLVFVRNIETGERTLVWAVDSSEPRRGQVIEVGPISLKDWVGEDIRLELEFNAFDSQHNGHAGWSVDQIQIQDGSSWLDAPKPLIGIDAFPTETLDECSLHTLRATTQSPTGELNRRIRWSRRDATNPLSDEVFLGYGNHLPVTFPVGNYLLKAETRGDDGRWSVTEPEMQIHVTPGVCPVGWPPVGPLAVAGMKRKPD